MTLIEIINHPAFSVISFIIGVLGIALAFIFYVLSKKEKTPCFDSSNNSIIEGVDKKLNDLEVRYKGVSQKRITVTKVVFWNDGKDVIHGSDIVKKDPLRIVCPENVEILDIQILTEGNNPNSVELQDPINDKEGMYYPVTFDYLGHKDNVIIQLVHNGESYLHFNVKGKLKGVRSIGRSGDMNFWIIILSYLPFTNTFIKLLKSKFFLKYIPSVSYLFMGSIFIWKIISGNTEWYFWLGAIVCFLFSGLVFNNFRIVPPVKI